MKMEDLCRGVIIDGRFKLAELLGSGSFGHVWRAEVIKDETGELEPDRRVHAARARRERKGLRRQIVGVEVVERAQVAPRVPRVDGPFFHEVINVIRDPGAHTEHLTRRDLLDSRLVVP